MSPIHRRILIGALCGLAALAAACTRSEVSVPSPTGPSTLSTTFEVEATPNVIYATTERPTTTVKGIVRKNGSPQANVPVYFTIISGPGEFSDYSVRTLALTDSTGVASVTFLGPTKYELTRDTVSTIQGQMQTNTPEFIYKTAEIYILMQ